MAKRGRPKGQPTNPLTRSRITEARERKGFSKMELSRQIQVDVSAVRKWENGTLPIPEYHLEAIATACEVPVQWLKGETVPDIIQNSMLILNNINPDTIKDEAVQLSEQAETESLTIIYALRMCGYTVADIKDTQKFSAYMTDTIRNIVETYMNNLNQ